jgi:hypothetical protein
MTLFQWRAQGTGASPPGLTKNAFFTSNYR